MPRKITKDNNGEKGEPIAQKRTRGSVLRPTVTTRKKSTPTSTISKAPPPSTKRQRPTTSRKHTTTSLPSDQATEPVITLPQSVPLRLKERSLLYRFFADPHVYRAAQKVSVVASICFMILGFTITTSGFVSDGMFKGQLAQTVSTDSTLESTTSTSPSEFQFKVDFPANISSEFRALFLATNAKAVRATLVNTETLRVVELPIDLQNTNEYLVLIQPQKYELGHYKLIVYVTPFDGSTKYAKSSTIFFNGTTDQASQHNSSSPSDTTANSETTASEFTFRTTFPQHITADFPVSFVATNAKTVKAGVKDLVTGRLIPLTLKETDPDIYQTVIPYTLSHGYYVFSVAVAPLDGSSDYTRSSEKFFVGTNTTGSTYSSSTTTTDASIDTTTASDPTVVSVAKFTTPIPAELTRDISVNFSVSNADLSSVSLLNIGSNNRTALTHKRVDTDTYQVQLPFTTLQDGKYRVVLALKPRDGSAPFTVSSTGFLVAHSVDTSADQQALDASGEPSALLSSSPTTLTLVLPSGESLSDVVKFEVSASVEFSKLELYARPLDGLRARFISAETALATGRGFVFDSKNIPNGDYEFFIKAVHNGNTITSKSARVTVKNSTVSTVATNVAPAPAVTPKTEATQNEIESTIVTRQQKTREMATVADQPYEPANTVVSAVPAETKALIERSSDDLNELMKRYAIAVQSGDESMIKAAKAALEKKTDDLATEAMFEERTSGIADAIEVELKEQVANLQKRVESFEKLREERSSGATAVDTDGDGVSDVDEEMLYGTDPKQADSDGDGFTDGAEIISGFDPTDAASEAVIEFRSPKESTVLARPDVLVVEHIVRVDEPITESMGSTSSSTTRVLAEIRGRGLPDSFITLYIFSSPVMVTVRTDADGYFEYTYTKELEDGDHEVYVAMTDNAGEIIAQSDPFSFIKTAEAFTPVANAGAKSVVTADDPIAESIGAGYRLAAGAGLLGLGIILFMLGIMLRSNRVAPTTPATDSASDSAPNKE